MTLFDDKGHMTADGFHLFISGEPDELQRLEFAEHLSDCDICLERYLEYMNEVPLMEVKPSQKEKIFQRVHYYKASLHYRRFAVAVAACMAIILWTGGAFQWQGRIMEKNIAGQVADHVYEVTQRHSETISDVLSKNYIKMIEKWTVTSTSKEGEDQDGKK